MVFGAGGCEPAPPPPATIEEPLPPADPTAGEMNGIPIGMQFPVGGGIPGIDCPFGSGDCGGVIYGATNGNGNVVLAAPIVLPGFKISVLVLGFLSTHWPFGNKNGKWWPSYGPESCPVYNSSGGGGLQGICATFGNGSKADSVRGCLQQYYNPDYHNGKGGYENQPDKAGLPHSGADTFLNQIGLEGGYGPKAHAYCVPEGIINH